MQIGNSNLETKTPNGKSPPIHPSFIQGKEDEDRKILRRSVEGKGGGEGGWGAGKRD